MPEHPSARATWISLRIELTKASEEKGRTMPEVPMMEIPPIMPSLGVNVFCASSLPPGTDIRTETPE